MCAVINQMQLFTSYQDVFPFHIGPYTFTESSWPVACSTNKNNNLGSPQFSHKCLPKAVLYDQ